MIKIFLKCDFYDVCQISPIWMKAISFRMLFGRDTGMLELVNTSSETGFKSGDSLSFAGKVSVPGRYTFSVPENIQELLKELSWLSKVGIHWLRFLLQAKCDSQVLMTVLCGLLLVVTLRGGTVGFEGSRWSISVEPPRLSGKYSFKCKSSGLFG